MEFHIAPGGCLRGEVRVPGDKSISHRSIMLGSLAEGETWIEGFLQGEDSLATLRAFRQMGVRIDGPDEGRVHIEGVGLHGLRDPLQPLDLGNSGTSMRLLAGLLAGQRFGCELIGDDSLSTRPMRRVITPLVRMGAAIQGTAQGTAPLRVRPVASLRGESFALEIASAQVKSAILLAGLYARGTTQVTEPAPTRDHTERMLRGFGYSVMQNGLQVRLEGGGRLQGCRIEVPADLSSAAFFLVGASIAPGSDVLLTHVGLNPTRAGVIQILQLMGADIEVQNPRDIGGEPVADLRVRHAPLRGISIPEHLVPLAIDEFPALFIAAACASGETRLTGARELRVKESDRIAVMADGLTQLGIATETFADGLCIQGGILGGGLIHSHGDHRIAMAFAMAGLRAREPLLIENCANVNTSFPGFAALAAQAGLALEARAH